MSGLFHDMTLELSRNLNFTPNFVFPEDGLYGNEQGSPCYIFTHDSLVMSNDNC